MTQESAWDREYKNSTFLTKENKPQSDVVRCVKWLKSTPADGARLPAPKVADIGGQAHLQTINNGDWQEVNVLDLGCGVGRNSFYFAEMGANVMGFEISKTAVRIAEENAKKAGLNIVYKKQSIGERFPLEDSSVDITLDITSSNSLTEVEREVYLSETHRVLKMNGYFFVKALCKEGDQNAKYLLKNTPGKEKDTYIMPELGVIERVWSKDEFRQVCEKYFIILKMEKKTSYTRMNNRSYKRNFWIVYMKKIS